STATDPTRASSSGRSLIRLRCTGCWRRSAISACPCSRCRPADADRHPDHPRRTEEILMRVLVAGATGVVGRRIVPLLLRRGDRVTWLTRSAARAAVLRSAGVDPIVVDVVDAKALTDAVRAAEPEVVLHQLTDLAGQDRAAN